jgi:hypothetical protein
MHSPKPLVLALIAVVAALAIPGTAQAARPCWKDLVDDYWADFRVDKVYPVSCYRDAMESLPRDVDEYSDAQDDLRRALLDAIRDQRNNSGFREEEESEEGEALPPVDDEGGGGFFQQVIDKLGPKNADAVPVPILVLGGIALLLFGAAGVSYGARWLQERQAQIATSPAPPDKRP